MKDRAGKPARAEVTLYAVDEGVLSLIGYKTPDPIPIFGAPRSLRCSTIESRDALARLLNPFAALSALDKGLEGGGGGEGRAFASDFRASAYFNPSLVTDARGPRARQLQAPRQPRPPTGSWPSPRREDDRFGYARGLACHEPPADGAPRFPALLARGRRLDAGIVVHLEGLAKTKVDVEASPPRGSR